MANKVHVTVFFFFLQKEITDKGHTASHLRIFLSLGFKLITMYL